MKKLFAIVLSMVILSTTFICSLSITHFSALGNTSTSVSDKSYEQKNEVLTLENIKQVASWEDLTNVAIPIISNYSHLDNKEDVYVSALVNSINTESSMSLYHNTKHIYTSLGGIKLKEIDYNQLIQKFNAIVVLYNNSNELQLTLEPRCLNEDYMQIDVYSTTATSQIASTTQIGELVHLKAGTTYWESCLNNGSGKYGVATSDNSCIPEDYTVIVNGFAYFDESKANVVEHFYTPYNEIEGCGIEISSDVPQMIHICTKTSDLGWIYPEDIVKIDCM